MECPVLGLFGGADQGIPAEARATFDDALREAGVEHTIVAYRDAPHSFFDRHQTEYAAASADAWSRILSFIQAHTAPAARITRPIRPPGRRSGRAVQPDGPGRPAGR